MPPKDDLKYLIREGLQSVKQTSAMNPLLWLCGIVSAPGLYLATTLPGDSWVTVVLVVIAGFPVASAIFYYGRLLKNRPELLRSEKFQLQSKALDLIESKTGELDIEPTSIEDIVSPQPMPKLPSDKDLEQKMKLADQMGEEDE